MAVIKWLPKSHTEGKYAACLDWSKAGELGYFKAYEAIEKNCN